MPLIEVSRREFEQHVYLARGDVSGSPKITPVAGALSSYFYVTNLDVQNPEAAGAVVTFGRKKQSLPTHYRQ